MALLVACARESPGKSASTGPNFSVSGMPQTLDAWGVLSSRDGILKLAPGVLPYDLATPLFSDYALKLRTIALPPGTTATYGADDAFDLPVGTIITKTFYYSTQGDAVTYGDDRTLADGMLPLGGLRLIETRVLARRADGWIALPYLWNAEMTEARLARTGALVRMTLHRPDGREEPLNYLVPSVNQCSECHATDHGKRAIQPIGIKARHLNKPSTFAGGMNQLDHWIMTGMLEAPILPSPAGGRGARGEGGVPIEGAPHPESAGADSTLSRERERVYPRNASWTDETESLDARARAYLDANCSHCHSDVGAADTSGLDLRPFVPMGPKTGFCKSTIAAGAGTGGRTYDIVPGKPEKSILVYRMTTNDAAQMMPELGRAVEHEEGVALISEWIREMTGSCG